MSLPISFTYLHFAVDFRVLVEVQVGDGVVIGVAKAQLGFASLNPENRHDGNVHLLCLLVGGLETILEDDVSCVPKKKTTMNSLSSLYYWFLFPYFTIERLIRAPSVSMTLRMPSERLSSPLRTST